jgi:hypothetical protein
MSSDERMNMMIKDAGFGLTPPGAYRLMVYIGTNSVQSVVFDPEKKKFVAYVQRAIQANAGKQDYFEQLTKALSEEELLQLNYKDTQVLWQTQCATLVPMALYDKEAEKTYLQFNQNVNSDDIIASDKLQNAGSYNIFAYPAPLLKAVEFMKPAIHHHASILIESLMLLNKHNINPTQVYVNVHEGFFDILVFRERKLLFCNSFAYNSAEDFIYFVLFTFEQLKLQPEKEMVTLSGEIVKDSGVYEIMYKYIRNLSFGKAIEQAQNSYILQNVPEHRHQNLFNTILCEL